MRRYTASFMEQRLGSPHLGQIEGADGSASFDALDDDSALAHLAAHFIHRVQKCVRAELSSMALVCDAAVPGGVKAVDDCLTNPYFQDMYVRFDATTKRLEVDFESTRTALMTKETFGLRRATR